MTLEQVQARLAEISQRRDKLAAAGITIIEVPEEPTYDVVWSGGELLPDRESVGDDRLRFVPSYDLDDGEAARAPEKRKYTFTGKHRRTK